MNTLIEENSDNDEFKWKESEVGKKYLELGDSIDEKSEAYNDKLGEMKVDTATEFEIKHHGNGQFGVGSWFGHCNAWAAAAIVEEEPRYDFEKDGVPWTAADIKGLLTSTWMESDASFHGSRNDHDSEEEAREQVNFKDVTPAAFHIFFADQIGIRDKSFVIDRYTGEQVWNQPANAYRSKFTPLYEVNDEGVAEPVKTEVKLTKYTFQGKGELKELGEQDVYPVSVTTTIWWVTDGLPHDALTVENIDNSMSDEDFANSWKVRMAYDDQIHIRTLAYTLWLNKPMDDEEALIIGDGEWNHGSSVQYAHTHPDFMWQPIGNTNNPWRVYENEMISYHLVKNELLPLSLVPPVEEGDEETVEEDENVPESGNENTIIYEVSSDQASLEIPDNDLEGITSTIAVEIDENVSAIAVGLDIAHTFVGDLIIELMGPPNPGNTVGCVERTTPTCDNCSCQLCVCDVRPECCENTWNQECADLCMECGGCEGPSIIRLHEKNEGGSSDDINKVYDVKGFEGRNPSGEWKLKVVDLANHDEGTLKHWYIEFLPVAATAPPEETPAEDTLATEPALEETPVEETPAEEPPAEEAPEEPPAEEAPEEPPVEETPDEE